MKVSFTRFLACLAIVLTLTPINHASAQKIDRDKEEEREQLKKRKPAKLPKQKITKETRFVNPVQVVNFQQLSDSQLIHPAAPRTGAIDQIEDKEPNFRFIPHPIPRGTRTFDPDTLGGNSHSRHGRYGVNKHLSPPESPAPSGNYLGTTSNGTLIPPDVDGAVGPTYVVETNNQECDIYTRSGTLQATVAWTTLFSSQGGNTYYDPHVLYDPNYQKFVLVIDGFFGASETNPGGCFVAISQTSDPTGSWYTYSVNAGNSGSTSTDLLDYPQIGYNKNWVAISFNDFVSTGVIEDIYVFNRDSLYTGRLGTVTLFTDNNAFSWGPAQTQDTTTNTLWLVQDANGASGAMQIGSITGTATAPVYNAGSDIAVTSKWNETAVNVGQLGGTVAKDINDDDTRVENGSVFINGSLWFCHTVFLPATGTATYSAADWWEITPSTLTVEQFGRIVDPLANTNYYYPSLNVNINGDALLGYCMSGTDSFYPSAAYSFRSSCDAVNTMESRYIFKAGAATYYETFGSGRNRYGDFTGTAVDPTDNSFWNFSEWAEGTTTWGTAICHVPPAAALTATAPASFGTNICVGLTAGPDSFTVTGTGLTAANVNVGPLTGFTFSTTPGGTYTSSLSISQPGCSFSQTIYVEFTPTTATSYNGNIPVSGGGAASVNVAITGSGSVTSCTTPTLSASALSGFGSICTGNTGGPNSFTISGVLLTTANVTVGPLSGFTFSTSLGGTFSSSLSLSQSGGSYSQTIYVEFSPTSSVSYNGNIPVGGGGASAINVAVTATGTGIPSINPGTIAAVCASASTQTVDLPYTAATNSPATYSISGWSSGSFANVANASLPVSPIPITVPATVSSGTYTASLTVANAGCSSSSYPISVTINTAPSAVIVTPPAPTLCSGSVVLTASGGSGGTIYYQGTTSNGTSTATPSTTETISTTGTYYFNAEGSNGCWSTQGSSTVAITGGISGTYTIPGSYATLTAAVAAYNANPICGPVVFQMTSSYSSSAEAFPITINANSGASSVNTLTIEPATGATPTISGSNATAIIKLNAANYVTINGSAGGTGSNQNLTIKNTNTGTSSTVIYVASTATAGATYNTIENCILTGNSATTTQTGIVSGGTTTSSFASVANSYNTYQNNAITKAEYGILLGGTTSSTETGISVIGNQISTCGSVGILADYEANLMIAGNTISSITSTSVGVDGILIQYTSTGSTISGNFISGISYTGGTAGTNVSGILLASSTTGTGMNIYNNMIWGITSKGDAGTGNNVYYNGTGITIFEGTGYNIYFNTISLATAQASAGAPACIWIYNGGTPEAASLVLENNILSNTQTTPSGVTPYGIYSEVAKTAFTSIDYNDYYVGTGTGFTNIGGNNYSTIANIETNFGGNTHSGIILPNFTSATDLDLLNYDNFCLAAGTMISGITTDIHGNARVAPDIGADEFTFSFSTTSASPSCINTGNVVTVTDPSSTLPAGTYTITYNLSGVNTATGSTATMTYTAGATNAGTFTIPAGQLATAGSTTITITKIASTLTCATALSPVPIIVAPTSANQATFNVQDVIPSVAISASPGHVICAGTNVSFTAAPTNGGTTPAYAWTVNGSSAGTNSASFSSSSLTAGAVVQCLLTSDATCASPSTAASNNITMTVNPAPASASISDVIEGCNGGHTATVNVTGGTSPYTFTLSCGSTYTSAVPYSLNAGSASSCSLTSITDANGCVPAAITGNPVSYPTRTLTTGSTQTCTIGANATQVFFDASGNLMAQISSGSTALGSTSVMTTIDGSVQEFGPTDEQHYLQRHFLITPASSSAANVCLYVSDAEVSALNIASANDDHAAPAYYQTFSTSLTNANITQYDGGSETPSSHSSRAVITGITATQNPTVNGNTYSNAWGLCFNVGGFSGFYINASNVNDDPLPVTLVNFTAESVNNKYILLNWVTASEINNAGFWLERSTDGFSYQPLVWVEGHGTSTVVNTYQYSDLTALPSVIYYYRLKQTDVDGNFTYSNIASASLTGESSFSIEGLYPNPANDQVSIGVISNISAPAKVTMTDMIGQIIREEDWSLSIGYNTNVFDLSRVSTGAYMITIRSGSNTATKKLTITR